MPRWMGRTNERTENREPRGGKITKLEQQLLLLLLLLSQLLEERGHPPVVDEIWDSHYYFSRHFGFVTDCYHCNGRQWRWWCSFVTVLPIMTHDFPLKSAQITSLTLEQANTSTQHHDGPASSDFHRVWRVELTPNIFHLLPIQLIRCRGRRPCLLTNTPEQLQLPTATSHTHLVLSAQESWIALSVLTQLKLSRLLVFWLLRTIDSATPTLLSNQS